MIDILQLSSALPVSTTLSVFSLAIHSLSEASLMLSQSRSSSVSLSVSCVVKIGQSRRVSLSLVGLERTGAVVRLKYSVMIGWLIAYCPDIDRAVTVNDSVFTF
jgi:hypothetical protein